MFPVARGGRWFIDIGPEIVHNIGEVFKELLLLLTESLTAFRMTHLQQLWHYLMHLILHSFMKLESLPLSLLQCRKFKNHGYAFMTYASP